MGRRRSNEARLRHERMRIDGLATLRQRGWDEENLAWVELYSRWERPTAEEVAEVRERFS